MNNKINEVVLVVDDSPESLGMLNVALNTEGYTALVALSGAQALTIVDKVEPDIILLDAVMPEMDGFESCRRLKQKLPNTPIVFMTGLTDSEDVVKGFAAGGIDYVSKPITPAEVLARIKSHIQTAKLALSAQNALDHAGKYIFGVNDEGRLAWATPHVYNLIDEVSGQNDSPWVNIAKAVTQWLNTDYTKVLKITDFEQALSIYYERKQDELHLLRIEHAKPERSPLDLQQALPITKRESEVLYWLSYGKTNWEISQILEMGHRTVNKHLEQLYKKIGVDNRTAAAAISIRILEA